MEQELVNLIKSYGHFIPSCKFDRLRQILSTPEGRRLVNTTRIDGVSLVNYALQNSGGCCKILVKFLIKAGANINSQEENRLPIYWAVYNNNMDGLIELIKAGANVNTPINNSNQTTIMLAANEGREIAVKELLKAGADVNLKDRDGNTALNFCENIYMLDIYDILVKAGAVFGDNDLVSNKKGYMEKHIKIYRDILVLLLEYTEAGKDLSTPLIRAIENNNVEIFDTLIRQGEYVNIPDYIGMTPLMTACFKNNQYMVKKLIEASADINRKNYYGNTALMMASKYSYLSIIFDLLEAGSDLFITNKFGDTALDRTILFKRERPIIDALKRAMNVTTLTTTNAYLRSRSDTSGLGPSVEAPLRGFSQNVWGDTMVMEQVLDMAYGEEENEGAEESKSDAGSRKKKSSGRIKYGRKKSRSKKSGGRKKSKSKRRKSGRKKSTSRRRK